MIAGGTTDSGEDTEDDGATLLSFTDLVHKLTSELDTTPTPSVAAAPASGKRKQPPPAADVVRCAADASKRAKRSHARNAAQVIEDLRTQVALLTGQLAQARKCPTPLSAEEAALFVRLLGDVQIQEMAERSACVCGRHHPTVKVCPAWPAPPGSAWPIAWPIAWLNPLALARPPRQGVQSRPDHAWGPALPQG